MKVYINGHGHMTKMAAMAINSCMVLAATCFLSNSMNIEVALYFGNILLGI